MKKITLLFAAATFTLTAFAQKEKMERVEEMEYKRNNRNCQIKAKLKITSATYDLLESYRKLLNPSVLCKGSNGTPTSFGKMDAVNFGNNGVTGPVTFSSFFEATDLFRTIWGSDPGNFTYYGVCPPPVIMFPNPAAAANHVFAVKLVPVSNYATDANNREYNTAIGIATANIKSFDCIKLEEDYGYIAASDNLNFVDVFSSKGILFLVTMKDGTQSWCYILNNYDKTGSVKWKEL
jgi:hypothetical protein